MRYRFDRSVRTLRNGRVLLGGSPGRLLRLTAAGAQLVERMRRGDAVGGSPGVDALLDRLVDAGIVHPVPPPGSGPWTAVDVTVVVPVRDNPGGLDRLLASIARGPDVVAAVVVVDDGSLVPIQPAGVVVERHTEAGGPAAARNTGARRAATGVLAFVDSDCTVDPDWLEALLSHFDDPRVAAVAPRVRAAAPARALDVLGAHLIAYDGVRSPLDLGAEPGRVEPGTRISYVPSATLLVRTAAFEAVGGFDAAMRVGEDVDLIWRLVQVGHRVRYEPRSRVGHEVRPSLRSWLAQRFGYGTSAAELDARHPGRVAPVVLSPWSAAIWASVALGHPLLAAGIAASTLTAMHRRLDDIPFGEVARLVGAGHLAAGRQLAEGVVRAWWPVALAACLVDRRARRLTLVAGAVVVAGAERQRRSGAVPVAPAPFAALTLADHLAYGAGLWAGAIRRRSVGALLPRTGPATSRSARVTGARNENVF